jgi:hypothetical protein
MKRARSGSVSQRYGSADQDPYKNLTDPEHSKYGTGNGKVQVWNAPVYIRYIFYGQISNYVLYSDRGRPEFSNLVCYPDSGLENRLSILYVPAARKKNKILH